MAIYQINKGINRAIEFKGLKAQYIGYLGAGLVALLLGFAVLYIAGFPLFGCVMVVAAAGTLLFVQVYRLSNKYGRYGLMKRHAKRFIPGYLKFNSRKLFHLKHL